MCVSYYSRLTKKEILNILKPVDGWFIGYKVFYQDGKPSQLSGSPLRYKVGVNCALDDAGHKLAKKPTIANYKRNNHGIHVYLTKNLACEYTPDTKIIEVLCNVKNIIMSDYQQAALSSIRILPTQWADFQAQFTKEETT